MRLQPMFICGVLAVCLLATVGWSLSTATVSAQADVTPMPLNDAQADASPELSAEIPSLTDSQANPTSQPNEFAPTQLRSNAPSSGYPAGSQPAVTTYGTPITGTPLGLPGPAVIPNVQYSTRGPMSNSNYFYQQIVRGSTDARGGELNDEYQTKQAEIQKLLQRRGDAKDERQWTELRQQIVAATEEQFDIKQEIRQREIDALKKRLAGVEATAKQRNEFKDQIVEKRVAELLREPDQLSWDPVVANGIPGGQRLNPGYATTSPQRTNPLGQQSGTDPYQRQQQPATTTYLPRRIPRTVQETIVDEEGRQRTVLREITETEYVPITPSKSGTDSFDSPPGGQRPQLDAESNNRSAWDPRTEKNRPDQQPNITVAEAAAQVKLAEAWYYQTLNAGGNVNGSDLKARQAELELAKLVEARARAEYEAQTKLHELDVRQAVADFEHAKLALDEADALNNRASGAVASATVAARRAAVEKAQIELERAKIKLDLHTKMNAPKVEQGSTERAIKTVEPNWEFPAPDSIKPSKPRGEVPQIQPGQPELDSPRADAINP